MNLTYFRPKIRGKVKKNNPVNIRFVAKTSDIRNLSENITSDVMSILSEVATLVSMIPNCWYSLEVATTELHLCFILKCNVLWKHTFIPMVSIVVLHHKHMKLFKPFAFTPHVIAWSVRKGSICRTKERKTRLHCLSGAMPKPVMTSGAMKSEKLLKKKHKDLAV